MSTAEERGLLIRGGRIVDPVSGRDETADLYVLGGRIRDAREAAGRNPEIFEAAGLVVVPGLIDLHVHLREPGGEEAETIETGSRAAARGGFTTIVAMPNTSPPYATPDVVAMVKERGERAGLARVLPSAAITRDRKGEALGDLRALAAAGAVAFTDDGATVPSDELMRSAMEAARDLGLPVMDHAQDRSIELAGGVMHEGDCARRFGLPGIPSFAEERIVRRDIELAAATGCRVHIQHVSSLEGASLIRAARARGLAVTGELTPHHLALCDADIDPANTNFKMNPPLRTGEDRQALVEASLDETLSCFATDHAPHSAARKALGFLRAPFGIVGLETAVGITYTLLVEKGLLDFVSWLRRWTVEPARILGAEMQGLAPGAVADIALLDVDRAWTVDSASFASKSRNTPFEGWRLRGRAYATILGGRVVWRAS
jgi:dihydroorotase